MNVKLVVKHPTRRERSRGIVPGLLYFDEQGTSYPVEIHTRRNKNDKWTPVEVEHE